MKKKSSPAKTTKKAKKVRAKAKSPARRPKEKRPEPSPSVPSASVSERFNDEDRAALARLAEGVWRLHRRGKEQPWAENLVEYFGDTLRELDVKIIDRTGKEYLTGETIEVLHSEAPEGSAKLVITETIRPTIQVGDQIVLLGQVVLGVSGDAQEEEKCQEK